MRAHVPLEFYGPWFKAGRYARFARTVDIAPTLAAILLVLAVPKCTRSLVNSRLNFMSVVTGFRSTPRFKSYGVVYRMFKSHPWFGVGAGDYDKAYMNYSQDPRILSSPDNQYLRLLAETGAVGLACFLWLIFYLLWQAGKNAAGLEGAGLEEEALDLADRSKRAFARQAQPPRRTIAPVRSNL